MKCIVLGVVALAAWGLIGYVVWIVWQISAYAGVNGF